MYLVVNQALRILGAYKNMIINLYKPSYLKYH